MSAIQNALVVGGGAAGAGTAILLAEGGVSVDLIDIKAEVDTAGSGITLQGNALRALHHLGVWEQVRAHGFPFDTLGLRAPDPQATLLAELRDIRMGGPDLPVTMGMYRPDLARILVGRAVAAGARIRFGTTYATLRQDADGVDVVFADASTGRNDSTGRYDLVVGADGIRSWTRQALGIDLHTEPTGMGIWRAIAPRPPAVTRTDLVYGGPSYIAGYCPIGPDSLYAYLVEDAQDRSALTPREALSVMRELSRPYHGIWDDIRGSLTDPTKVNYTWFESHLLPAPWHRGRVVLIGDAAHACPPTLAQGAAQALEDAVVLSELLLDADTLDDALWQEFTDRRFHRAEMVVDASLQLARWLLDHERGDVPTLMERVARVLGEPA